MNDIAIQVDNVSKRYRIGRGQAGRSTYGSLRETLADAASAPLRRLRRSNNGDSQAQTDSIWALKDVSFEVKKGEVVGIIGRNGAGKSTLLKVLSRITRPTQGKVRVWGRVGSLLEVGTGFHPELTGRENIYLNGAVLGMRREEIERKFDEIVDFAEIEQFLDTPVKRYSSGMYMRLAFAVAAHLEPEILLVDEVLSVGDAAFQKKCLGKMGEVAEEGRTVMFVSHNMAAVNRLCKYGYLFDLGSVVADGVISQVIDKYHNLIFPRVNNLEKNSSSQNGTARFAEWKVDSKLTSEKYTFFTQESCRFKFRIVLTRNIYQSHFGIAIWSEKETLIWAMRSIDYGGQHQNLTKGEYQIEFYLPELPIRPGLYQIQVSINSLQGGQLDVWYPQPLLRVLPKNESGIPEKWQGLLNLKGEFSIHNIKNSIQNKMSFGK